MIFRSDAMVPHTCVRGEGEKSFADRLRGCMSVDHRVDVFAWAGGSALSPRRVYAIGDLHGDVEAAMACFAACKGCIEVEQLSLAPPLSWSVRWVAGCKDAVVQCGDVLDRSRNAWVEDVNELESGADEELILLACNLLSMQARVHGGCFARLLGNHELMNVSGDMRYATRRSHSYYQQCCGGRKANFEPGSRGARDLVGFGARCIARVGNFVFMHAGIATSLEQNALKERYLRHGRQVLGRVRSSAPAPHEETPGGDGSVADALNRAVHEQIAQIGGDLRSLHELHGFFWDRRHGELEEGPDGDRAAWCLNLQQEISSIVRADDEAWVSKKDARTFSLVVGHCTQPTGISAACRDSIWRVDAMMSRGFDIFSECHELCSMSRRPQVLLIPDSGWSPGGPEKARPRVVNSMLCLRRKQCEEPY